MKRVAKSLRIAIVEDHTLFAESLDVALTLEGHEIVRISLNDPRTTLTSVLAALIRARPQVLLLDLELAHVGSGLRLIDPLRRAGVAVVVVTGSSDTIQWGECLRYGARTVLAKSVPLTTILTTINHIGEGRAAMPRSARDDLVSAFHLDRSELQVIRSRLESLTPREHQVLAHLMQGHSVREIAASSVVAEATVRTQVKAILSKMQVTSQLAAVGLAHRLDGRGPRSEPVLVGEATS